MAELAVGLTEIPALPVTGVVRGVDSQVNLLMICACPERDRTVMRRKVGIVFDIVTGIGSLWLARVRPNHSLLIFNRLNRENIFRFSIGRMSFPIWEILFSSLQIIFVPAFNL
jgi:hypothetical protein